MACFHRLRMLTTVSSALVSLWLLLLAACAAPENQATPTFYQGHPLPHLLARLPLSNGANQGVLAADHRLYVLGETGISLVAGTTRLGQRTLPDLHPPYGQILRDIAVDDRTGLVYVLDNAAGAIHVLRDTTLITTMVDAVEQPEHIIADEDSGEMYAFYTAQVNGNVQSRALVLAGTEKVAEFDLPLHSKAIAYNPVDGHIYVASHNFASDAKYENALTVIDHHQVITTIHPLDQPDLSVEGMAINPTNGDVYVLLASRVVYWDRVHPPQSIDLYALGYKNLQCITVDPKRGWAYVCSWMDPHSYALVLDKNHLVKALPVADWPAVMAVDFKHDYVYVGHDEPFNFSVLRGTEVITTLKVVGAGATQILVDPERDYIYTANAGDAIVDVFSFNQVADKPSLWQAFLTWLGW